MVVFSLSLPILILLGGTHIILFKSTIWSLPSSIAHILGILAGFIIYQVKLIYKITLGLILIIFSIWVTLYGFTEYWLQRVYFGTLSGNVIEKVPLHSFKDQRGELVTLSNLGNKLIILDFWHTRCGACFRKFPELQENYLKYKQDPDVYFYAVNIPNERDTLNQATRMLEEIGYTFPVIIAESNNLADSFNIHVYPTIIIINEGKEIIYRGEYYERTWGFYARKNQRTNQIISKANNNN